MTSQITDLERQDVEAVVQYGSYKEAARQTGRSLRAITQSFFRIREKVESMRHELNWVESQRRKLPPKKKRYLEV